MAKLHKDTWRTLNARRVRQLVEKTSGPSSKLMEEQDALWKEWTSYNAPVAELLKKNACDEFKARAITVLLMLDFEYKVYDGRGDDNNQHTEIDLGAYSENLKRFVFGLVKHNMKMLRSSCQIQRHDRMRLLARHNSLIRETLALLPEDSPEAQDLFESYELWGWNDNQLYPESFSALLHAPIPEKWKLLADKKVRRSIENSGGEKKGQGPWREDVLRCYARELAETDELAYSSTLFASRVAFCLAAIGTRTDVFFSFGDLPQILKHLGDNEELSLHLLRFVLFGTFNFPIYLEYEHQRAEASTLANRYRRVAPDVSVRLDTLIEGYDRVKQRHQQEKRERVQETDVRDVKRRILEARMAG